MPSNKYRSVSTKKPNIRTSAMKHVVGFILLTIYFLIVIVFSGRSVGSAGNGGVILFILSCFLVYGLGVFLYKPLHKAWINSGR